MKYYKLTDRMNMNDVVRDDGETQFTYRYGTDEWIANDKMRDYFSTDGIKYGKYIIISEDEAIQLINEQKCLLNKLLANAMEVAAIAHQDQLDKGGNPYILHPRAVAEKVTDTECKIVAYLHDVCEDSDITLDDLVKKGFTYRIVNSVRLLTKSKNISYDNYLESVKNDYIAREVKISDLKNNMDITRITNPTKKDFDRIEKYKKALLFLQSEK